METQIQDVSVIETALAQANITQQILAKLKADYMGLTINGLDDKAGFIAVETARKECKSLRGLTTSICKAGREEAIKIQKEWIAKEKEVTGQISEVEDYLEAQSDAIKEEEKKILFEAAQRAKLPFRKDRLLQIETSVEDSELLKINDEQFNALFNDLHQKHFEEKSALLKIEQDKIEAVKREYLKAEALKTAEEKRQKDLVEAAENARIAAELKAKTDAERKEFEAQEAKAKAEQFKIDQLKKIDEMIEKAEREKQEAIVKAEVDKKMAIAEMERKQIEKETAILKASALALEIAENERLAGLEAELSKGDKAKFSTLVSDLESVKTKYTFKSKKHQTLSNDVNSLIDKIINHINSKA